MEKSKTSKKKLESDLLDFYSKMENIYPIARTYKTALVDVYQGDAPKDQRLMGYTSPSDRKIYVDKNLTQNEMEDTIAHELLHSEYEQMGDITDRAVEDPLGAHNPLFDSEVNRRKALMKEWLSQVERERSKKLSAYETLIRREQEKLLGPAPDLKKK